MSKKWTFSQMIICHVSLIIFIFRLTVISITSTKIYTQSHLNFEKLHCWLPHIQTRTTCADALYGGMTSSRGLPNNFKNKPKLKSKCKSNHGDSLITKRSSHQMKISSYSCSWLAHSQRNCKFITQIFSSNLK